MTSAPTETAPRLHRVADFLALRRSIVGALAMALLVGMGEQMAERFLPIYLLALGGTVIIVGALNGMQNLLAALYAFPGGYLSERIGVKRALLVFNLAAIAGYLIVIVFPYWQAVLVGAALFISWSAISLPATMGLIAKVLPKEMRTMGVSVHALMRRIPKATGPLLGGVFIGIWGTRNGVRYAFVAAVAMALLSVLLQQILLPDDRRAPTAEKPVRNPFALLRDMGAPLRSLLVSDILIRFSEQIPYAFLAIWAMQTIAHPVSAVRFGALTTIEMVVAILCYLPVAYFADQSGKKPFVLATFVFFAVFPLMLFVSRSFPMLVLAFVIRGMKEFGEPTRKALIVDLAPEGRKAVTFGAYYLMRDVVVSVAAFSGGFLWKISPATNLLTAFAFGAAGAIWFAFKGRDLPVLGERERVPSAV